MRFAKRHEHWSIKTALQLGHQNGFLWLTWVIIVSLQIGLGFSRASTQNFAVLTTEAFCRTHQIHFVNRLHMLKALWWDSSKNKAAMQKYVCEPKTLFFCQIWLKLTESTDLNYASADQWSDGPDMATISLLFRLAPPHKTCNDTYKPYKAIHTVWDHSIEPQLGGTLSDWEDF